MTDRRRSVHCDIFAKAEPEFWKYQECVPGWEEQSKRFARILYPEDENEASERHSAKASIHIDDGRVTSGCIRLLKRYICQIRQQCKEYHRPRSSIHIHVMPGCSESIPVTA